MASRVGLGLLPRKWAAGPSARAAFLLYLLLAAVFLGSPVAAHPGRRLVGGLFRDPQIFVWSFAWWPHAILHGQNPFFTHAIWEPDGYNLTWVTSVPGLAIVFAPVTLLFGPILAYNAANILMPALSASTAFLLCRRLTAASWPSLAGGYLFGFSAYVFSAELTHIFSAAVFLLPVAVLLVLDFLDGELSPRGFAVRFGLVLAGQLLLSTEILFTLTLALAASLLVGFALGGRRRSIGRLLVPLAGAYALAGALTAPFLWFVLTGTGSRPPPGAEAFTGDLLNLVVPTMATVGGWWGGHLARHFPANDAERGSYLGLPTLAIVVLYACQRWRTAACRFLLAVLLLAVLASLGSRFTVDGRVVFRLPWRYLATWPLLANVMPVRLMVYATLAAAVVVALWAASSFRPAWLRVALPVLAVLAVSPNLSSGAWSRTPVVPQLFTTSLYKSCLGRGENVLLLPFGTLGDTMLWQVRSGFWFQVAGGYVTPFPPPGYTQLEGIYRIATEEIPPDVTTEDVLQLVHLKQVTSIVLDADEQSLWGPVLAPLARPQAVGGTLIYRLLGAPPLRSRCAAAAAA